VLFASSPNTEPAAAAAAVPPAAGAPLIFKKHAVEIAYKDIVRGLRRHIVLQIEEHLLQQLIMDKNAPVVYTIRSQKVFYDFVPVVVVVNKEKKHVTTDITIKVYQCWINLCNLLLPLQASRGETLTLLKLFFFLFNCLYSEIIRSTKDQSLQSIPRIDSLLRLTETLSLSETLVSTTLL
jgi:hypothetical protein